MQYDERGWDMGANCIADTPDGRVLATRYVTLAAPIAAGQLSPEAWAAMTLEEQSPICQMEYVSAEAAVFQLHPDARQTDEGGSMVAGEPNFGFGMGAFEYRTESAAPSATFVSRLYLLCNGETGWLHKDRYTAPRGVDLETFAAQFAGDIE